MRVHKAVTLHPLPDFGIAIVGLLAILRLVSMITETGPQICSE